MKLRNTLERIYAIDIIRGYFLFVIIIDHLGRFFGFYELFTGRGVQWVSAAEGFFFVSGMMVGLIRGRKTIAKPFAESWKHLWQRAFQLYLWSIGLTFFFTVIAYILDPYSGLKPGYFLHEPLTEILHKTLTLQYTYGWADFLVYYAEYLLVAPLAIWLLRKKLWWLVLALSGTVWAISDRRIQTTWQILFFGGVVAGFYLPQIESYFKQLPNRVRTLTAGIVLSLAGITLATSLLFNTVAAHLVKVSIRTIGPVNFIELVDFNTNILAPIFDKYRLTAPRILLFALWFSALYYVVRRYEGVIQKSPIGKFFIPLGQNSLYVYIVHAVMVFGLDLISPGNVLPIWLNILINTTVLGLIFLMIKYKVFFKIVPR